MKEILIDGNSLTLCDFINITRKGYRIKLTEESIERMKASRKVLDDIVEKKEIRYGINTGFGKFSEVVISRDETKDLQRRLIKSHACGVGNNLKDDQIRGIMLLRINALAKGFSGISERTFSTLVEMLNKNVLPVVPAQGSLGASGDLAPLSHMALPLMGLGYAKFEGEIYRGDEAMKKAGISTIDLVEKEGIALINGTCVMASIGALALYDAIKLSKAADLACALSSEALLGITDAYDSRLHMLRGHRGQIDTAENLRRILEGSKRTTRQGELRVQDAYSLRCVPQIHGASKDTFEYVKEKLEIEFNSTTDNPIIFPDTGEIISGGNFHGQPVALPFDFLSIGAAELANVSERRLERLVNPALSNGLPAFLIEEGGINSGFMLVQYAAAALVSENKVLAHPASVDSIPSSANQEDHVSMGTIGARQAGEIVENAKKVVAMEIFAACQALDLREDNEKGKGSEVVYNAIRGAIPFYKEDREMYIDINKAYEVIFVNDLIEKVEETIGRLK